MSFSKGSNTTTTQQTPTALPYYQNALQQAQGVAATPYTPYTGELVSPVNQQQQAGVNNINQYAFEAQPMIQQAAQYAMQAAQPITGQQIQNYQSPYTQDVINATMANFANTNAQQQQQVLGNAAAQGALGGDRTAVAQANLAGQQQTAQAPVLAGLENTGYSQAVQLALQEQQNTGNATYSLGNLGVAGENAALTGANAQVAAGTLQQQTQQAQDQAAYQQFEQQLAYPFQATQWLAGIDTGVGSQEGGTSSTTAPPPNSLNAELGLGAAGLGAFGQFAGSAAGSAALAAMLARGGAVHHPTVPESEDTLKEQQKHLVNGNRRVQMFPHGTRELDLPKGMRRLETPHGVFHFNPEKIGADRIRHASKSGKENHILDLGPHSKDSVLRRTQQGEHPIAIVERTPEGTEVRAAAGTWHTLSSQLAAMEKKRTAGNSIHVEDPSETIAHRRAFGGRIEKFDSGGAAGMSPYGVSGSPYSAGVGWVPSIQITSGKGAPPPPNVSQPQTGQGVASPAYKPNNNTNSNYIIGSAPEAYSPLNGNGAFVSDNAIYNRGGSVPIRIGLGMSSFLPRARGGFADGGTPYDSDYMDATFKPDQGFVGGQYNIATDPAAMAAYAGRASTDSSPSGLALNATDTVPLPMSRPASADSLPPQDSGVGSVNTDEPLPPALSYADQGPSGPQSLVPQEPQGAAAAPSKSPGFLGLSPDFYQSLMAAGLGMAASRSPFVGQAIGEGGLQGLQTYGGLQKQHLAEQKQSQDVDLRVRQLDQQAKAEQDRIAQESRQYNELTAAQKADLEFKNRAQQRLDLQPVKIGTDMSTGTEIYGVRDPATGGFRRIDPVTGQAGGPLTPPPGTVAPQTAPTSQAAPEGTPQPAQTPNQKVASLTMPTPDTPPNVHPEVLQAIDPTMASQIKALDEGRMQFPTGFALKSPYWQNMLRLVSNYDPSFDAVNYNARAKTRADFVAGKSAQNITSFNTAIGHLDNLDKSIDALNNTAYPSYNKIANLAAVQTGNTRFQSAQKDFMAAKQAVTDELTRAFRGSGGNVHDIVGWENTLSEADSPQALHEAVKTAVNLLRSRIESVGDQYNRGMGTTRDPLTLLSPHAAQTVQRLSGEGGPQPSAVSPTPPAPGAKLYQGKWYARGPNGEAVPVQ